MISVKIESRWIGLQGPSNRISLYPERTRRNDGHQADPDPADRPVRQRSLRRGELHHAQREGGHRRKGMNGDRGSGIQQRREGHWKLRGGFIAKTSM